MAILTFSFNTGAVSLARIIDAMALEYGYSVTLPNGQPNPQTKAEFAKTHVGRIIAEAVMNQDRHSAHSASDASIIRIQLT